MEQNNKPLISVVTVSYNAATTIEETMLSVINQTYENIEYIIIDGGSTDGTVDIIKKYADRIAYWVSEPDGGIYDAMNKGIKVATGEWINFMNAGDRFVDKNVILNIFQLDLNNVVALYGDMYFVTSKNKKLIKAKPVSFTKRNMPCSHQALFCRIIEKKEILFNTSYKIAADYNVFYNLYWKYGENSILKIKLPVVLFDGTGLSSTNKIATFREVLKIRNAHRNFIYYWDCFKDKIKLLLRLKY